MITRHGWRWGMAVGALLVTGQAPSPPVPPSGRAGDPAATPGLLATQVSVAVDRDGSRRRFRATVLRSEGGVVTIVTAAHCISDADRGWPAALLFGGGVVVEGAVDAVTRNPLYHPNQPRELPGPDNAVARLRFRIDDPEGGPGPGAPAPASPVDGRLRPVRDPIALAAFRSLRPVGALSARAYPGAVGETVEVRAIDARGVEHAVRAGNHSNPRWLEWGRAYQPIPGDSGGGVFVLAPGAEGRPRPVLIGVIVGRDDRGGGASLVSLDQGWVAGAMRTPPPAPTQAAAPGPAPAAVSPPQ